MPSLRRPRLAPARARLHPRPVKALLGASLLALAAVSALSVQAAAGGEEATAAVAKVGLAPPPVDLERFPRPGPAPLPMPRLPQPHLVVEKLDGSPLLDVVPFDEHGEPVAAAFEQIAAAFQSRGGHRVDIDPRLVELLIMLSRAFDDRPIALVSAHREAGRGTRKTSYHVKGMAADVAIRGVKILDLQKAAVRLGAAGVGYYPTFVHVDARKDVPYRWSGYSWRRWRGR